MNDPILCFEVNVEGAVECVWEAWTTVDGVTSFFAPACRLELYPGGAYEMYFNPEAPEGLRGGEGCTILAIEEMQLLSFTWNAPPEFPTIRSQRTHVSVRFTPLSPNQTQVIFTQDGWGTSEEWQQVYRYFQEAWAKIVLPRLKERFIHGPIRWS
jgi:uncharacterized protein YndB with AHSA1/START domain